VTEALSWLPPQTGHSPAGTALWSSAHGGQLNEGFEDVATDPATGRIAISTVIENQMLIDDHWVLPVSSVGSDILLATFNP
jgi:hypothetical protein